MSAVWMKRVFFWIQKTSKAHISLLDIKVHTVQYWWEIMELLRCGILSGIAKVHMLNIRTSLFTTMTNVVYYNVMKTEWEKPIDQSILFINRFKVELTFSLCKTGPVSLFSSLVKRISILTTSWRDPRLFWSYLHIWWAPRNSYWISSGSLNLSIFPSLLLHSWYMIIQFFFSFWLWINF